MTRIPGWDDDVPYIGGESREFLEQLISETGLPPPDRWEAYDVYIDREDGTVTGMITAGGVEFQVEETGVTVEDPLDWDWVWSIWDWIAENYPDVDIDSHYTE